MFLLNCRYTIGIPVKADVVWDTEHWLFVQLYKSKQHYKKKKIKSVTSKNSVSAKNTFRSLAPIFWVKCPKNKKLIWCGLSCWFCWFKTKLLHCISIQYKFTIFLTFNVLDCILSMAINNWWVSSNEIFPHCISII